MAPRWVQLFIEGEKRVHNDDQNGQPSLMKNNLMCTDKEKIMKDKQFTMM